MIKKLTFNEKFPGNTHDKLYRNQLEIGTKINEIIAYLEIVESKTTTTNTHGCLNCGSDLTPVKDPKTKKISKYLFKCPKCNPKAVLSIG